LDSVFGGVEVSAASNQAAQADVCSRYRSLPLCGWGYLVPELVLPFEIAVAHYASH